MKSESIPTRMRIAIVARRVPLPMYTGINLVVHHLAARLAVDNEVVMLVTDDDSPQDAGVLPFPVRGCGKSGYGDGGAAVARGETYSSRVAGYYGVPDSRIGWLQREVSEFGPDVVLGFGYDLAAYLKSLIGRWPVVFDPIDSEILYLWRRLRSGRLQLATMKHLVMSVALARGVLARCNSLITVSREDTDNLRFVTGVERTYTVPNGVDCDFFRADPAIAPVPGRIIFTGSMGWPPNAQAVEWFLDLCWDRILHARPDASLVIVGKGMSDSQRAAFERCRNVQAIGFVEDIRAHVLASEVSIAPMISGSGIKNKVLESWAMSRAVVATSLAARGLQAIPRQHFLVAEGHVEFAQSVVDVLSNTALRDRLGAAGRELALADYSWASMAGRMTDILAGAVRS